MSVPARYENGVFGPLEEVKGAANGEVYRVFSEEELHVLKDELSWLKAAERGSGFWDNEEHAVYDDV
jgi:predicted DNA-binding antitoxin AbrB/MazE fold protein